MQPHSLLVRVTAALCGSVLLASAAIVAVRYGTGSFTGGYTLTATFSRSSQGLDDQSSVKVRGVNVGGVDRIRLRPDGRADVTLHLDPGTRIAATTTASIEPLSVFGPAFINLHPGTGERSGPFLRDGDHVRKTTAPLEFTDVLDQVDDVLDAVDPKDLSTIFHTFGESVAGLGPNLRRTLDSTSTLVDLGARHLSDTQRFLADLHLLSASLVDHAGSIAGTITNADGFASTVADRTDELDHLLTGSSQIASALATYLHQHGDAFGTFVQSAASVLDAATSHVTQFPDLFRLIDEFFGRIGDALRLEAPGGLLVGALHGGVLTSLCANFNLSLPVPCGVIGP
jgi:phospholipid/cholesterol/gamma-HCH transport system substrate-binding protein